MFIFIMLVLRQSSSGRIKMKRFIQFTFLFIVIIIVSVITAEHFKHKKSELDDHSFPLIKSNQTDKEVFTFLDGDIYSWINKSKGQLRAEFGEPKRKDLSAYGYTWWVYHSENQEYVQFGLLDDKIVTIFTTGDKTSIEPLQIGQSYQDLSEQFTVKEEVTYKSGLSFYSFKLNEEDIKSQPLIKLADDLFVQCYFDLMTDELSSIRILTGDTLVNQRFYELEYRGKLPEELDDYADEWKKVEAGLRLQIYDLTNVLRARHKLKNLSFDEDVAFVAYNHSKDMFTNNYFSHYRQDGTGLGDRLAENNIYYLSAGENIAAQYSDGPAAVHGWLNSEGHREALLDKDYNYLGVGVY